MTSDRKQPLWPWVVALLIGLPVLYVASFGPACWLANRGVISIRGAWSAYLPLFSAAHRGPAWVEECLEKLATTTGGERVYQIMKALDDRRWRFERAKNRRRTAR